MKNFKPESLEIRKAVSADIPEILILLSELNSEVLVDRWKPFFNFFYSTGEPYFGYVLEVENQIQGFIGTVISDRKYNDTKVTCCNIHGWIVREKYKQHSLKMMTEVLKQDMVFTCFSAMEITQLILKRMKFFFIDRNFRIYRPKIAFSNIWEVRKIHGADDVTDPEEKKIVSAHLPFKSEIIEIRKEGKRCLLVLKPEEYIPAFLKYFSFLIPSRYKRLLKLEYISETEMFYTEFKAAAFSIMLKIGAMGFILPADLLDKSGLEQSKKYFGKRPYMYRYNREKYQELFPDTLFSEMFVLNHKG